MMWKQFYVITNWLTLDTMKVLCESQRDVIKQEDLGRRIYCVREDDMLFY